MMKKPINLDSTAMPSSSKGVSQSSNNDLLALLQGAGKGKEKEGLFDFSSELDKQIGDIEEGAADFLNKLVEKTQSKEVQAENFFAPQKTKENKVLSELLSKKSKEIDNEFVKAKSAFNELDVVGKNLEVSEKGFKSPYSPSSSEKVVQNSIIPNKPQKESGETFYKGAEKLNYKSIFNVETPKKEIVKESKNINDFFNLVEKAQTNQRQIPLIQAQKAYGQNTLPTPLLKNKNVPGNVDLKDSTVKEIEDSLFKSESLPFNQLRQHSELISSLETNPTFKTSERVNTLDMGQINSGQTEQIIEKISDYITQKRFEANPYVELNVKHQELGDINIAVERLSNETLNIAINTASHEGRKFFASNQNDLFQSLTKSGLMVNDLKIESSSSFAQTSRDGSSSGFGGQSFSQSQGQFMSEDGQRRHDSQRRQEIWSYYQQHEDVA